MIYCGNKNHKKSGDNSTFPTRISDKHGNKVFFRVTLKNGDFANVTVANEQKQIWQNQYTRALIPHSEIYHWKEYIRDFEGTKIKTIN